MTTKEQEVAELKLCINCTHYDGITATCRKFTWGRSLVDGKVVQMGAATCRADETKCGKEAMAFEPRKLPF